MPRLWAERLVVLVVAAAFAPVWSCGLMATLESYETRLRRQLTTLEDQQARRRAAMAEQRRTWEEILERHDREIANLRARIEQEG